MTRYALLVIAGVVAVVGCATVRSQVMPGANFTRYTAAYLEAPAKDEFNLTAAFTAKLSEMGLRVVAKPAPASPDPTDMIVRFTYTDGWDLTKYLKGFQIQFLDAGSRAVVAQTSYYSTGIWIREQARIDAAFEDLKQQINSAL